jgi:ribose 5-phosphate isomerase A
MDQAMYQDALKREVGRAAAAKVEDGMVLGLGTGSTAEAFLHALAERVGAGLTVRGVPTSQRTAQLCEEIGIPLTDLDRDPELDLAIDGADEIDTELNLIKGGGGALLREKIVAAAAKDMLVIADGSKLVDTLGRFPLPIEIIPFGASATLRAISEVCASFGLPQDGEIRRNLATSQADSAPFETDGGHWIVDCRLRAIDDVSGLDMALRAIPGVVETGLFIGMASQALIARNGQVDLIKRQ